MALPKAFYNELKAVLSVVDALRTISDTRRYSLYMSAVGKFLGKHEGQRISWVSGEPGKYVAHRVKPTGQVATNKFPTYDAAYNAAYNAPTFVSYVPNSKRIAFDIDSDQLRDAWTRARFTAWLRDVELKLKRKYDRVLTAMKESAVSDAMEFKFKKKGANTWGAMVGGEAAYRVVVKDGQYKLSTVTNPASRTWQVVGTYPTMAAAERAAVDHLKRLRKMRRGYHKLKASRQRKAESVEDLQQLFEKKKPFRIRPTAEGDILYKQWKKWGGGRQYEPEFFRLGARYLNFYSGGGKDPNRSFVWIEQYGGDDNYRVVATTENGAIRYKDFKDLKSAWKYAGSLKSGRTFMKYVHGVGDDATKEVPAWTQGTYTRWIANFRRQIEALQKNDAERARIRGEKRESALDISIVLEAVSEGGLTVGEIFDIAIDDEIDGVEEATTKTAEELFTFIQNERALQKQKDAIISSMKRKVKSGKYNSALAAKGWMYLVNDAAKAYVKQHGERGDKPSDVFPASIRKVTAGMLASHYDENELANY